MHDPSALYYAILFIIAAWGLLVFALHSRTDAKKREADQGRTRESEAQTRAILDTAVDGIITIDEHAAVLIFNPAAEKIFGYSQSEVLGNNVNMLMPEPYHSQHDTYLRNYLTSGKPRVIGIGREVSGRRKDGSEFPMELSLSEVRSVGTRIFTGVVRDITERKLLERQKADFYAMVSHDVRSPITVILGYTDLILTAKSGGLDAETVDMVSAIERNCIRISNLLEDFLAVSKIESAALVLSKKPEDISEFLGEVREEFAPLTQKKGLGFSVEVAPGIPKLDLDRRYFRRVIDNLVNNAVNYTPGGGTITVRAGRLTRDGRGQGVRPGPDDSEGGHGGARGQGRGREQGGPWQHIPGADTGQSGQGWVTLRHLHARHSRESGNPEFVSCYVLLMSLVPGVIKATAL